MRSPGWKAAAVSLCASIFVIAACGGGSPAGDGTRLLRWQRVVRRPPRAGRCLPAALDYQRLRQLRQQPQPRPRVQHPQARPQALKRRRRRRRQARATQSRCRLATVTPAPSFRTARSPAGIPLKHTGRITANWATAALRDQLTPVFAVGITSATAITTSTDDYPHTCAVLADGTIRCWGYNADGELGNGSTVNSAVPLLVSGITNAVGVSAGWHEHVRRPCGWHGVMLG